jgi:VanZ family protein
MLVPLPQHLPFWGGELPDAIAAGTGQFDKFIHGAFYLGMFLLAVGAYGSRSAGISHGWLLAACAAHGALSEIAQCWVPSRYGTLSDWMADVAGSALGAGLIALLRRPHRP